MREEKIGKEPVEFSISTSLSLFLFPSPSPYFSFLFHFLFPFPFPLPVLHSSPFTPCSPSLPKSSVLIFFKNLAQMKSSTTKEEDSAVKGKDSAMKGEDSKMEVSHSKMEASHSTATIKMSQSNYITLKNLMNSTASTRQKTVTPFRESVMPSTTISSKETAMPSKESAMIPSAMLSKAIQLGDLEYIQESISSGFLKGDIQKLTFPSKKKLVLILVNLLEGELCTQVMECIYSLLNDIGNVEGLKRALMERRTDFSKLHYLKGRIDYLKYKSCCDRDCNGEGVNGEGVCNGEGVNGEGVCNGEEMSCNRESMNEGERENDCNRDCNGENDCNREELKKPQRPKQRPQRPRHSYEAD